MKKTIIFVSIIIVLAVAYWLVSPFFIDKKVSEDFPVLETSALDNNATASTPQKIATGAFSGFDKIHYGSGTASLIKTETGHVIRFEEDFNVANGPDLYVGLGKDGKYIKGSEISKLKGNIGSQNYVLPENFDINTSNEVWIWCKAFSVPFAKATLAF